MLPKKSIEVLGLGKRPKIKFSGFKKIIFQQYGGCKQSSAFSEKSIILLLVSATLLKINIFKKHSVN